MDQKMAVGKRGRWALKLQDFDFEIILKPNKKNQVADALSRHTYTEVEDESISSESICCLRCGKVDLAESETIEVELFHGEYPVIAPLDPEVLQPKLQNVDPDFQNMHAYLSSHVLDDEEEVKRTTVAEAQYFPCVMVYFTNGFKKGSKRKVYQTDMSSNGFAT
jgi:hypothetical protein